jgi:hypothetical protein
MLLSALFITNSPRSDFRSIAPPLGSAGCPSYVNGRATRREILKPHGRNDLAFLLPFGEGRVRQTFLRFGKIVCRTRGSEVPLPAPVGASLICSARRAGVSLLCRPRPAYPRLTIGQHRRITSPTLGLCGDGSLMTQLLPGGASLVTGMAYAVLRPDPDSAAAMWGAPIRSAWYLSPVTPAHGLEVAIRLAAALSPRRPSRLFSQGQSAASSSALFRRLSVRQEMWPKLSAPPFWQRKRPRQISLPRPFSRITGFQSFATRPCRRRRFAKVCRLMP